MDFKDKLLEYFSLTCLHTFFDPDLPSQITLKRRGGSLHSSLSLRRATREKNFFSRVYIVDRGKNKFLNKVFENSSKKRRFLT